MIYAPDKMCVWDVIPPFWKMNLKGYFLHFDWGKKMFYTGDIAVRM